MPDSDQQNSLNRFLIVADKIMKPNQALQKYRCHVYCWCTCWWHEQSGA